MPSSIVVAPFYIPTNSRQNSEFSLSVSTHCFSDFFMVDILRCMRDHGYICKGLKLIARLIRTGLVQNWEKSMSNLCIVTLLV